MDYKFREWICFARHLVIKTNPCLYYDESLLHHTVRAEPFSTQNPLCLGSDIWCRVLMVLASLLICKTGPPSCGVHLCFTGWLPIACRGLGVGSAQHTSPRHKGSPPTSTYRQEKPEQMLLDSRRTQRGQRGRGLWPTTRTMYCHWDVEDGWL